MKLACVTGQFHVSNIYQVKCLSVNSYKYSCLNYKTSTAILQKSAKPNRI